MLVWLSSYPRSGNTFLRILLHRVFGLPTTAIYDERSKGVKDAMDAKRSPFAAGDCRGLPDDWTPDALEADSRLWLLKTHDARTDGHRAIVVYRDGRNASLSYRDFLRNGPLPDCTVDDVILGSVTFGSWSDHMKSWLDEADPRILAIPFTELVETPERAVKSIGAFLGVSPTDGRPPTFDELHALNPTFFSSGLGRDWKKDLSLPQRVLFELLQGETLERHGFEVDEEARDLLETPSAPSWVGTMARMVEAHRRSEEELLRRCEIYENSSSWRMTRPLRRIRSLLSGR